MPWLIAARAFLKGLSPLVWVIAALALLLAIQTARIEGFKVWPISVKGLKAELKDARAEIKRMNDEAAKASQRGKEIAKDVKDRNDEDNRRIVSDAGTLRVSGPGKAVCPRLPAAARGQESPSGKPDVARPEVPPADLAAVPWDWLTNRAEQADLNRAEVIAWREWYDRIVKEWPAKQPQH